MQTIHKHILDIEDKQECRISNFVKVLSVIEQNNKIVLYALIDDIYNDNILTIRIIGTGHPITTENEDIEDYKFANTVSTYKGDLMWHIFYKVQKRSFFNRRELKH